jgi:hypothetical protein
MGRGKEREKLFANRTSIPGRYYPAAMWSYLN